ncbi:MAG: DUF2085 domain-containing protein [Anaerolineales bacterium]|jgi:uncharacterized membrane protein/glutaredoxin
MRVTLYTKKDCHLCEQAQTELEALHSEIPHQLVAVDIEADPALRDRFLEQVPVVKAGPYTLQSPFTSTDLRVMLTAAQEATQDAPAKDARSRARAIRLNRMLLFLTRHWLAILNLVVFIYVGLPFAAPVLMKAGATAPARTIYSIYSPLCHQLGYRSWYLFGDQPAYPLALAGTSMKTYEEITGVDNPYYADASSFLGDEQVGYKVGLCQRDVAIYGGMLVAGLVFALLRRRMRPIPFWLWLVAGIFPIMIDGGTQILAAMQLPWLKFLPLRESTPLLRTLTGGLFGLANVWLAYPYLEESMADTRALLVAKLAGVDAQVARE